MRKLMRYASIMLIVALAAVSVSAQTEEYVGEAFTLSGHVLDENGEPIAGARVEIWQTDANGNYNHPNDADPSELVPDFQYFGTATTDDEGAYTFTTIKPAAYESRPSHIHVKVKLDGDELLTTQFYFAEDGVTDDPIAAAAGASVVLERVEAEDETALPTRTTDIIIGTTPAQAEGPYYPVVDFSTYDSDLTSVGAAFTLLNLNTAAGDDFLTIPDMSNRMVREFEEYRPYVSIVQFRREIGKYVDDAQVAAYEAYVYVPVDVNESDAATLMQIPGVDEALAAELIAARPFASNDAFLEALAGYDVDVELAANYLA